MPETLVTRDALASDLPAIVEIYNATIASRQSTADLEPVSVEQRHGWFLDHHPDRRPLWVVEEASAVVAWLSFRDFYGRPAYAATAEIGVYVRADRRRRGLGRLLVERAIERSPKLGLTTLLALVFAHNAASVRLFELAGFQRWGTLPEVTRLEDQLADVVIFGRHV